MFGEFAFGERTFGECTFGEMTFGEFAFGEIRPIHSASLIFRDLRFVEMTQHFRK
mgnify:CR=1 FL=1